MEEMNSQTVHVVVTANNINSDLEVIPFLTEMAAQTRLRNLYDEAKERLFDQHSTGEFDTDECSANAFQLYDSKSNDMEYGIVEEITVPIPEPPAPSPSRTSKLAAANLEAKDRLNRCRSFAKSLYRILDEREDIHHGTRGKKLLKAIRDNDLNAFVLALTGYDCADLMNYAHIIRDTTETFSDGPRDAKLVYYSDGNRKVCSCKVDLRTNRVFDIYHEGEEAWFSQGIEYSEEFINAEIIRLKLEGFGNFNVVSKDAMKMAKDQIVFWYGPEDCDF